MAQGKISENNEFVTYEIALNETNLVEAEQLEELKRPHPLFLPCDSYKMENQQVTIHYKKQPGYTPLVTYLQSDLPLKQKIAEQILQVEDLIGTQYTVLLSPNNIFVEETGQIKFAHRGIRSVLPPEELPEAMLQEVKDVIIFLLKTGER
ncbi:type VII secretion protein EssB/YukC [Virgibacillus halophilus]|uniref:Type VII secretion protein EssB/YukC n=1 Tax=Tigheibacillus halophilus TaxID=361280 RepID=A0ABU5C731_9BACI|nr:type VII secretion protein EssB/YukC [Virgibacillus halophilus]